MKRAMLVLVAVALVLFGVVAYAGALSASGDVTVTARVNPKLSLAATTTVGGDGLINWVDVDPNTSNSEGVNIIIDSNRTGKLYASWVTTPTAAWNIDSAKATAGGSTAFVKAEGQTFNDTVTFNPDYQTPSNVAIDTWTLRYTAIQD